MFNDGIALQIIKIIKFNYKIYALYSAVQNHRESLLYYNYNITILTKLLFIII